MTRANRDFRGDSGEAVTGHPSIRGFNPGGDDFGVVRIVDGSDPFRGGIAGNNVHVPGSSESPDWDVPVGPAVVDMPELDET